MAPHFPQPCISFPKEGSAGGSDAAEQFQFGFIGGGGGAVFESIKPFSKRHHLLPPASLALFCYVSERAGGHMPPTAPTYKLFPWGRVERVGNCPIDM